MFVRDSASFLEVLGRLSLNPLSRGELIEQQVKFLKRAFSNQGEAGGAVWKLVQEKLTNSL